MIDLDIGWQRSNPLLAARSVKHIKRGSGGTECIQVISTGAKLHQSIEPQPKQFTQEVDGKQKRSDDAWGERQSHERQLYPTASA